MSDSTVSTLAILQSQLGADRVLCEYQLKNHLTMHIAVTAEYFFEARNSDELVLSYRTCKENGISFRVIGGGSNSVFGATHLPGLTVKDETRDLQVLEEGDKRVRIRVSSGYPMSLLVAHTVSKGWEGFEYHRGLPGLLGGALYMNSKWMHPHPSYVGDRLVSARLLDREGKLKTVDRAYFEFAYDHSILQHTREMVIDADFELSKNDPVLLEERAHLAMEYRHRTQPMGQATCGCFFRNIESAVQKEKGLPTTSAGYLIDQCGLKGFSVGSFGVSTQHANFIINSKKGESRVEDLNTLVETVKQRVFERFGIRLVEEVVVMDRPTGK